MNLKLLQENFHPNDIEWRLQSCGKKNGKFWGMCLAYVTNRAIQNRLDEVCGAENWKNEYSKAPDGGVLCGISIKCGDGTKEWVTKYDGAENTDIEQVKGGLSGAMKRAAVQWGIGRYLYNLPATFAVINDGGRYRGKTKENEYFKWNPPSLPSWALPNPQEQEDNNKELVANFKKWVKDNKQSIAIDAYEWAMDVENKILDLMAKNGNSLEYNLNQAWDRLKKSIEDEKELV